MHLLLTVAAVVAGLWLFETIVVLASYRYQKRRSA